MANITTAETINGIPTIVAARALENLKSNSVLSRLVARDWDSDVASYGDTVNIVNFGAMTTSLKQAGDPYAPQVTSDAKIGVTLDKHRYFNFIIEDTAHLFARPDYLAGLIDKGVKQMAADIDKDLAALYAGFSQVINATAGLTKNHFYQARKKLSVALAPQDQRVAVLHPDAVQELSILTQGQNTRNATDENGLAHGFYDGGALYANFNVYEDQNVVFSTNNKNMFFHREAMALVVRPLPAPESGAGVISSTVSVDGMSLRVTMGYDLSQGGYRVVCDCLYGVKELRDAFGITVLTSAQA